MILPAIEPGQKQTAIRISSFNWMRKHTDAEGQQNQPYLQGIIVIDISKGERAGVGNAITKRKHEA